MRTIIYATLLARISSRRTLSVAGIGSHRSFHQATSAAQPALQATSIRMAVPYGSNWHEKPGKCIANWLEEYKLNHWGFVIYRCTYSSQEKWDKFLALAKQEAYDCLEQEGTGVLSLYDKMDWTVIEDAETLDGASILDTTRRFRAWVEANVRVENRDDVGRVPENQGSTFTHVWQSEVRYHFFMHVDEESLESVVDDEKARDSAAGYFCKIVRPSLVRDERRGTTGRGDSGGPGPVGRAARAAGLRKEVQAREPCGIVRHSFQSRLVVLHPRRCRLRLCGDCRCSL
ncbi:hypothetical protein GE09DRAFT_1161438, partial [Coniochaeta sp. 2T2.1]